MRRTGILTFQKANNHGALMQAYALQESLRAGGDEVTVIDYTSPSMRSTQYHDAIFDGFREQYLNISRPVRAEEIKNLGLDRVVIGSDQVWNPNITGEDATYFLPKELRGTIQVLSYAASLGIQNPEIKEKAAFYRANLKDHAKISLREEGNAETLYEVLMALPGGYAGEITAHIDPTLLLDQEDYEKLAQKEPVEDGGYIFYFSYNTDPRLLDFVNLCSAHTGLPVVASSGFGPAKFLSNALVRCA